MLYQRLMRNITQRVRRHSGKQRFRKFMSVRSTEDVEYAWLWFLNRLQKLWGSRLQLLRFVIDNNAPLRRSLNLHRLVKRTRLLNVKARTINFLCNSHTAGTGQGRFTLTTLSTWLTIVADVCAVQRSSEHTRRSSLASSASTSKQDCIIVWSSTLCHLTKTLDELILTDDFAEFTRTIL